MSVVSALVAQIIAHLGIPRDAIPRTTHSERIAIVNALHRRAGGDETAGRYAAAATALRAFWHTWNEASLREPGAELEWPREFELALKPAWSDFERRVIDEWLKSNAPALRILVDATARPSFNRPPQHLARLSDMHFQDASMLSSLAKLALVRARADALRGATTEAVRWNRRARRIAEHLYQQPFWIEHAVGTAIERNALAQLWMLLPAMSRDEFATEMSIVRTISTTTCPIALMTAAESLFTYDVFDGVFAWATGSAADESVESLIQSAVDLAAVGANAAPDDPLATVAAFRDSVRRLTLAETWALQGRIAALVDEWSGRPFWDAWRDRDRLKRCWELARDNAVIQLLCGTREEAIVKLDAPNYVLHLTRAHRRATLVLLAVHAHKQRTGEFPAVLTELSDALSPDDCRDPFSGESLIWRAADVPGGYTLYSVGPDQHDDGGRHNGFSRDPGDFVYWPPTMS
ncbi:MAG: hypothetical protein AB7Q17_01130 [Phycisphaerae bacterium]